MESMSIKYTNKQKSYIGIWPKNLNIPNFIKKNMSFYDRTKLNKVGVTVEKIKWKKLTDEQILSCKG